MLEPWTGQLTVGQLTFGTVVAAGTAVLPDMDHPDAKVARSLGPLSRSAARIVRRVAGGHRQRTHSLAFVALVAWALTWLAGLPGRWPLAVTLGVIISLSVRLLGPSLKLKVRPSVAWAVGTLTAVAIGNGTVPVGRGVIVAGVVGAASHLIGDGATRQGVPLLWPWKARFGIGLLRTGGRAEQAATGLLSLTLLWLMAVRLGGVPSDGGQLAGAVAADLGRHTHQQLAWLQDVASDATDRALSWWWQQDLQALSP